MRTLVLTIATVAALIPQSAMAQDGASIQFNTPVAGEAVGRTFTLAGTVSRGGGALTLKIDGNDYVPATMRSTTGDAPQGFTLGETPDGHVNAPFSIPIDLTGSAVASGEFDRQRAPLGTGPHQFQLCQGFGPTSGCGTINLTVTDESPQPARQPVSTQSGQVTPVITPTPSTVPAAVHTKTAGRVSPALGISGLALLGILVVILVHRFSPTGPR